MNKEDLWNLFRITGKIEYYLEYKKIDRRWLYEYGKSRRDNS